MQIVNSKFCCTGVGNLASMFGHFQYQVFFHIGALISIKIFDFYFRALTDFIAWLRLKISGAPAQAETEKDAEAGKSEKPEKSEDWNSAIKCPKCNW